MEAVRIYKMVVPDEHFTRIQEMLKEANSKIGVHLTHKNGNRVRFYHDGGKTFADERKEDNSVFTQEVIPMSEVEDMKRQHSSFRETLMKRLKDDHPDWSQEELDASADILTEANESIKKLIAAGVDPRLAQHLIEAVLADKNIERSAEELVEVLKEREQTYKAEEEPNSGEALGASLCEREEMFGKPGDPEYGE
jgi:hypothetical protein